MSDSAIDRARTEVSQLDRESVSSVARLSTGDPSAVALDGWSCEPLDAVSVGNGTVGFLRVSGAAATSNGHTGWSSVVKVINTALMGHTGSFNDPRREIEVYRSGCLARDRAGLKAVDCYRADDSAGGVVLLWLKDLTSARTARWTAEDYAQAARDIGSFNGLITLEDVSELQLLDRSGKCDRRSSPLEPDSWAYPVETAIKHPLVQRAAGKIGVGRAAMLRDDVATLIAATADCPKTVSHNDCHTRNLFVVRRDGGEAETRAVDWASVGVMPLGLDAGSLVASGFTWGHEEADMIQRIEPDLFDAYFQALREAGWTRPRDEVRLVYLSSFSAYALQWVMSVHQLAIDGAMSRYLRKRWGLTPEEAADEAALRLSWMVPLVDEALELAK